MSSNKLMEKANSGFVQLHAAARRLQKGKPTSSDKIPLALVLIALFLLAAPLDVLQLSCAVVGAIVYAVLTVPLSRPKEKTDGKPLKIKTVDSCHGSQSTPTSTASTKPTAVPIKAPVFAAPDFDAQVDELVCRITPTPACKKAVEELTFIVRQKIQSLIPEVEVMGFATGDLRGGTAYGVAVPEVDIVANASPTDLTTRLQGRLAQTSRQRTSAISRLDTRKLQKSAIRVCTSLLVSVGFKFRRSSFRSEEPKVTLLAPSSMGVSNVAIPVDFSVNNTTPLYNMALLTECGQMDPRAKSLILLVRRWAKDRGVCHASQGHLPPYAWSLLVIYFLQVGVESDCSLPLPALEEFAMSSGLMTASPKAASSPSARVTKSSPTRPASDSDTPQKTIAQLFKEFIRFYNKKIDWRREAVSVRLGKRGPPPLALDIHIVIDDDGATAVSPIIEDPFDSKRNLGCCTTWASLKRFHSELDRADRFLTDGTSLTQLLEPWRPPEHCAEKNENEDQCEDDDA